MRRARTETDSRTNNRKQPRGINKQYKPKQRNRQKGKGKPAGGSNFSNFRTGEGANWAAEVGGNEETLNMNKKKKKGITKPKRMKIWKLRKLEEVEK